MAQFVLFEDDAVREFVLSNGQIRLTASPLIPESRLEVLVTEEVTAIIHLERFPKPYQLQVGALPQLTESARERGETLDADFIAFGDKTKGSVFPVKVLPGQADDAISKCIKVIGTIPYSITAQVTFFRYN